MGFLPTKKEKVPEELPPQETYELPKPKEIGREIEEYPDEEDDIGDSPEKEKKFVEEIEDQEGSEEPEESEELEETEEESEEDSEERAQEKGLAEGLLNLYQRVSNIEAYLFRRDSLR